MLAAIAEPDNLRLAFWNDFVVWRESASDLRGRCGGRCNGFSARNCGWS